MAMIYIPWEYSYDVGHYFTRKLLDILHKTDTISWEQWHKASMDAWHRAIYKDPVDDKYVYEIKMRRGPL